MKKACAGSISVFYAMIFLVVLAFLGSLFMYGKQQILITSIRSDLDAAGFSVLGEYQKDWAQEYGLYVLPKSQIESDMQFYLDENSRHSWGEYSIDEITVTEVKSLQDISVLQEQILMFMSERGLFDFIEEVGASVLQIQNLDQQVKEEINWKESEELLLIQTLYGQLVTDLEGIRADGYENPYSINHLFEEDPKMEELLLALEPIEPSGEEVGILERAYDELDQVAWLCADAVQVGNELEKALQKVESAEDIPITVTEIRKYQRIWKKNQTLCQEASVAIQTWVNQIGGEPNEIETYRSTALQNAERLSDYDRSIYLPFEYKKSEASWDFDGILSYFQGYPSNISDVAPDEELELGLETAESDEDVDLDSVMIDDSFADQFLVTEYALGVFQNFEEASFAAEGEKSLNLRGEEKKGRFFNNEVEYLLMGKPNEYENVNGTRHKIIALRSVLNMIHLLSDAEKRAEIELIASTIGGILLPGIGNGIIFGVIVTIWSLGEATVDYRILSEGGMVPLLKDKESWRTDLAAILSMDIEDAEEDQGEGFDYKQYLRILLYTVNQKQLLTRIQNLLYLNRQKHSLAEAVTSFVVEGTATGLGSKLSFSGEYGYGSYAE